MNKLLIITILLLACFSVKGQSNIPYEVNKTIFDFGKIQYKSSGTFEFTIWNNSDLKEDNQFKVSKIKGCCPCRIIGSKNSEKVINPGDSAKIQCQYDTRRIGPINKSISVNLSSLSKIEENKDEVLHLKIIGKVARPDSMLNPSLKSANICVFNNDSIVLQPYQTNPEKLMVYQSAPFESSEKGINFLIPFIDSLGFKIDSTFYIPENELYSNFSIDSISYYQYENDTISDERFKDFSNNHSTISKSQLKTFNYKRPMINVIVKKKNNANSRYIIITTKNGKPISSMNKRTISALRSNQFIRVGAIWKTPTNEMGLNYLLYGFDCQLKLNFKDGVTDDRIAIIMSENSLKLERKCRSLKTNDKCYIVSFDKNITYGITELFKELNQYLSLQIIVDGMAQTSNNN